MITGQVSSALEAMVEVQVADFQAQLHAVQASIDTGYTGFLTLPPATVTSLGLAWVSRAQGLLADGSLGIFDVYRAAVMWDGNIRLIDVEVADADPLLGMALLHGYEFFMQVIFGGRITISPVP
jgi:clan AA aspartic protease